MFLKLASMAQAAAVPSGWNWLSAIGCATCGYQATQKMPARWP
jgi:hypothetical protein